MKKIELKTNEYTPIPTHKNLSSDFTNALQLIDDIILKNYISDLNKLEVIPMYEDNDKLDLNSVRFFKITEMVYEKDEMATNKFASVFNSLISSKCSVFIILDSNGNKTDFYMGIKSYDEDRTTRSFKESLENALKGQFPGIKTEHYLNKDMERVIYQFKTLNISSASCVANNKIKDDRENKSFIQGLEKLALSMSGKKYTAIILAGKVSQDKLQETRKSYERLYTQLSPFSNRQISYSTNESVNLSEAISHGTSYSSTHSKNKSVSTSEGTSESETKPNTAGKFFTGAGMALAIVSSVATTTPIGIAASMVAPFISKQITSGKTDSKSKTQGSSYSDTNGRNDNVSNTKGVQSGTSQNMTLTLTDKAITNILERIDAQFKRLQEFESLGMWECAAYFMSDDPSSAEMGASTYKSLMQGENTGLETSAVNSWIDKYDHINSKRIRQYVVNFMHPKFLYDSSLGKIPVDACSYVSGNELALHMGLPRKSVCGFPVIEHADFGKEVVKYNQSKRENSFALGNIFSMGRKNNTEVRLDLDSLTMHTFVTGSTGSGKSNTVYEILNQVKKVYHIPFLIVEPAKGEYKNVFGQFPDISVYGTNPKKFNSMLRINPFRFPSDIHVLEHLDRLVEIFNVCWPMYAAMPAILKESMEKAYIAAGWDIGMSENPRGEIFPNFTDLLEQIENVINESKYSSDSKGDYSGALCTRVKSLTTGLNGVIFCNNDLTDKELFDRSAIVDLSRVGSTETKSLIMGLLVMKLNEYRMTSGKINSQLSHITVLEEAHNLLKRTSTEQSSEGSNLLGKSVELLANSIAEMRTYGEGFIIADQAPGLLDMSVIRNTNTKIILRLPEQSDRELAGKSAGLNEEQISELSKLERGVAAVYQNDWVEPVLVKVNKCAITEKLYQIVETSDTNSVTNLRSQLLKFLVQGRLNEILDFNVSDIERGVDTLNLSLRNKDFIREQIDEYKANGKISIWSDTNFKKLSRLVTDLLDIRSRVEHIVSTTVDNTELTNSMKNIVFQADPTGSSEFVLVISQCLLKDMSMGQSETDTRERIYMQWMDSIIESGVRR